jgi:hypothetical protein
MNFQEQLIEMNAVSGAITWASGKTLQEFWEKCPYGHWLIFLLEKMEGKEGWLNKKEIMSLCCPGAKKILYNENIIVNDEEKCKKALEARENYINGNISLQEMEVKLCNLNNDLIFDVSEPLSLITSSLIRHVALFEVRSIADIAVDPNFSRVLWDIEFDEACLAQADFIRSQFTPTGKIDIEKREMTFGQQLYEWRYSPELIKFVGNKTAEEAYKECTDDLSIFKIMRKMVSRKGWLNESEINILKYNSDKFYIETNKNWNDYKKAHLANLDYIKSQFVPFEINNISCEKSMNFQDQLIKMGALYEEIKFAESKTFQEMWETYTKINFFWRILEKMVGKEDWPDKKELKRLIEGSYDEYAKQFTTFKIVDTNGYQRLYPTKWNELDNALLAEVEYVRKQFIPPKIDMLEIVE